MAVGIIGAGLMGRTIAFICAEHGLPVLITDADTQTLERTVAWIRQENPAPHNVTPVSSLDELSHCALVIEAIIESLKPKRQLFARLEQIVPANVVLASNASVIPIGQMAAGLQHPERVCGIHFCHPARYRPVLEVVRAATTGEETIIEACRFAHAIDRQTVLVKDQTGFVVNRALHPYMNEAQVLLQEGASLEEIDNAATDFGMPWGPLTQLDEIGIDTIIHGALVMARAYPGRPLAHGLILDLYEHGRLGRKTNAGHYRYDADGRRYVDADVEKLIARQRRQQRKISPAEMAARLFGRMGEESRSLVAEGVVADRRDVETALCVGLGYPRDKTHVLWTPYHQRVA